MSTTRQKQFKIKIRGTILEDVFKTMLSSEKEPKFSLEKKNNNITLKIGFPLDTELAFSQCNLTRNKTRSCRNVNQYHSLKNLRRTVSKCSSKRNSTSLCDNLIRHSVKSEIHCSGKPGFTSLSKINISAMTLPSSEARSKCSSKRKCRGNARSQCLPKIHKIVRTKCISTPRRRTFLTCGSSRPLSRGQNKKSCKSQVCFPVYFATEPRERNIFLVSKYVDKEC
jgi:hypothetical protein